MTNTEFKNRLLATSLLAGIVGVAGLPAAAQDQEPVRIAQADDDDEDRSLERITVTGSRLNQANLSSSSPVTTLDAEAFAIRGTTDAIDLINTLPSASAAQTSEVSNGATGTANLDLRNLGTTRTLVLVDGKRLPPGRADSFAADLNLIPPALIERSEIVTGGQSAVYGSDAIAGVANFILRRDFEGVEFNGRFTFNQDRNSSDFAQGILAATEQDGIVPTGNVTDGETYDVSALIGVNTPDGKGNITGYFRYLDAGAITQGGRDISQCALSDLGSPLCLGSNFGPFPTTVTLPAITDPTTGLPLADQPGIVGTVSFDEMGNIPLDADGNIVTGASNAFNFNPLNFFQRPTTRFNAGFLSRYELHEKVEAYLDFGFTENVTDAQIAPSATFGEVTQINCDNPFLSPEQLDLICTSRGFGLDDDATVQINRRAVESGPRNSRIELTNFRVVGGFRGEITDGWNYDVFGQFATTRQTDIDTEDFEIDLLNESLNVVLDENGVPVCESGNPACVPLNLFGPEPPTPEAFAFSAVPELLSGEVTQTVYGASITGDLGQYGIASPLAQDGIQALFGIEYREEDLVLTPDVILLTGNATGLGGPADPTDARTELFEFYTEVGIPLIQDTPFFQDLSFNGAYRFSTYDSFNFVPDETEIGGQFQTNSWALGLSWTPVDDIRLRGQFQRAIRAPNILELFAPQSLQLFDFTDPCGGPTPAASVEGCANTGLIPELFGLVPADAGQLQQLAGGNPDLEPEESDTFTVGAIIQPRWVDGLTISVDYFDIEVDGFINNIPSPTIIDTCINTGDPTFCSLINRDALGTLQIDGFVEANLQNIATRSTNGLDFSIQYNFDSAQFGLPDVGSFGLSYISTVTLEYEDVAFEGDPATDCLAQFGQPCTGAGSILGLAPIFDYRHTMTGTWRTNYNVDMSVLWRRSSPLNNASLDDFGVPTTTPEFLNFPTENFIDVFLNWNVRDNISLNFGVNNVFDNDPPVACFCDTQNGNTFPGTFDSAGRTIFTGFTVGF